MPRPSARVGCCSLGRVATAPASTARSRRSSTRSSTTARRSTSASRSCTTCTSCRRWRSAARSSSRRTTRCPKAPPSCSRPTASRRRCTSRPRARQLRTIDATCPLVTKVHHEARGSPQEGYDILLIGHEGHEEVVGTTGEAPEYIPLVDGPGDVVAGPGPRPGTCRLAVPDHAVGRRDDADRRRAARAVPDAAVAAVRRHLLRDPEPAGRGEDDRAGGRAVPRRGIGELVELGAHGRGRAGGRRPRPSSSRTPRPSTTRGWTA